MSLKGSPIFTLALSNEIPFSIVVGLFFLAWTHYLSKGRKKKVFTVYFFRQFQLPPLFSFASTCFFVLSVLFSFSLLFWNVPALKWTHTDTHILSNEWRRTSDDNEFERGGKESAREQTWLMSTMLRRQWVQVRWVLHPSPFFSHA